MKRISKAAAALIILLGSPRRHDIDLITDVLFDPYLTNGFP